MPQTFLPCLLLFSLTVFSLGWPCAARLRLEPAEKVGAAVLLSLVGIYAVAFAIYLLDLPRATFWILPVVAAGGLVLTRPALVSLSRNADVAGLLAGQLLVTGWCIGWLFFTTTYSGGGWTGDWYEHWERTRFFLNHWPLDTKFIGVYDLSARPPLANLVTGALLALFARDFAHYQLFTTLLSTLVFLPAALLARRFQPVPGFATGGRTGVAVLVLLLMANPSFVENATFAWTKLLTVFFILSGLYLFLRACDPAPPPAAAPLCATALAAGLLAHYSAGPYVLLLALAWPILNRARWRDPSFRRQTTLMVVLGGLLLATWFGWSFAVYGARTTLLSNSSVTVTEAHSGNQLVKIALNLRDTVVPHFLRPLDETLITQTSPWGYWHDWFFQLYQLNLFFVLGSLGWLVLIRAAVCDWREGSSPGRWFWAWFCSGAIVLGVAVHGARDTWGLVHICLQSLVVLGLAYLAARWSTLPRGWRLVLIAGATVDFVLGIALHFAVQSFALDRWLTPARPFGEVLQSYSGPSLMNSMVKFQYRLGFFPDTLDAPAALVLALLALILTLAVVRATRRQA